MKQNDSETESNWHFQKKCKNMSTKQESVSDAAFKTWPFSSDFNFADKLGPVTEATWEYFPLVVGPTITNCCKELHLKNLCLWKLCHVSKIATPVLCENQSFFLLFQNAMTFTKNH